MNLFVLWQGRFTIVQAHKKYIKKGGSLNIKAVAFLYISKATAEELKKARETEPIVHAVFTGYAKRQAM